MTKILLLDSTITAPIDELAKDMDCQSSQKNYKLHFFYTISCDEITNTVQILQLSVYVSFNRRVYAVLQIRRDHV